MNPFILLTGYFRWHYTVAFSNILYVWGNFIWFIAHFFSLGTLAVTLFSPWHRLREVYRPGLAIGENLGTLLVNVILRIVGAIMRLIVIFIGIAILLAVTLIGAIFLVSWTVVPILIPASITLGFLIF